LIFSNLSAAAAFFLPADTGPYTWQAGVTFCAAAKSYKDFYLIDAYAR